MPRSAVCGVRSLKSKEPIRQDCYFQGVQELDLPVRYPKRAGVETLRC